MKNWTTVLKFCIVSVVTCASLAFSQKFPDTIWVPVTFYDFHSDRSNPEFEQPHKGAVRTGMVAEELGTDGKPEVGAEPYMNYYISKWFKPWKAGDFTIPQYDSAPYPQRHYNHEFDQEVNFIEVVTVDYDTAFKNVVIYDSLPFVYDRNGGFYAYRDDNFFPLDGRGFGNEWNHEKTTADKGTDHNYSFTMELHWSFVKEPGMHLTFNGDDDIWVFIDKKLQIDIGGIHNSDARSVNVDNISGLTDGEVYDLDIFYAERHSRESHIWITTNIIFAQSLRLYKEEGTPDFGTNIPLGGHDTVLVGEPYTIYGHVFDSVGVWTPEFDSKITWGIRNGTGGELTSKEGVSTTFTSDEANSEVTIYAQYKDTISGNVSVKTITLYVKSDKEDPVKSYDIILYDSSDDPESITPVGSHKTITVGEEYTLYGHIFDETETWIKEYDSLITWEITKSKNTELTETKGATTTFKSSEPNTEVTITAHFIDPVSRKDVKKSIQVTVKEKESFEIRLYDSPGDPKELKPVASKKTIIVGDEYTLYGHVFDQSGNWIQKYDSLITWEVTKSKNLGLTAAKGKTTTFISTEPNSEVTITAKFTEHSSGKESLKSVELFIDQKAIPSFALKLYDSPGDPSGLKEVNSNLTVTAGETVTIYGHIFDMDGKWYEKYDRDIKWKLKDVADDGVKLDKAEGEYTSVSLTAVGTVRVVGEFVDESNPAKPVSRAEISITINPAAAYKIDIQKSKDDTSNAEQYNFNLLVFEKNVSIDSLYGIVRDKFGNFIRYADDATWKSGDVSVVKIIKSEGSLGIVEQQKNGVGNETFIIVSEKGLIPDTIKVSSIGEKSAVAYVIKPGERIPQTIRNYYNKLFTDAGNIQKGTLVAIEAPRPLLPDSSRDKSFGKVVVYDAVGNVVRSDLKLVPAGTERTYGILWDFTNRNKRQVGQGAYLFVVTGRYLDNDNRSIAFNEKVKVAAILK